MNERSRDTGKHEGKTEKGYLKSRLLAGTSGLGLGAGKCQAVRLKGNGLGFGFGSAPIKGVVDRRLMAREAHVCV